jgi:Uncharacterised protein family (UPF0175)
MVEVTVQLPDEIARQFGIVPGETPRSLIEAIAAGGYRSDKLSLAQTGQLLGMSESKTAEFLAKRSQKTVLNRSEDDFRAFQTALPSLLKSDRGRYVAISGGRVIDRDLSEFTLVDRVSREHPEEQVLIQPVVEGGLIDVYMDTPEFEPAKGR